MAAVNPGTTSLVAWWALNETSGNRADSHGSNTLTDVNTVDYAAGVQSNAASFTAANLEQLQITDNAALSMGDIAMTMVGWFYSGGTTASYPTMICKRNGGTTHEYLFGKDPSTKPYWQVSGNGTAVSTVYWSANLSSSTWYFFVCYHDPDANTIGININQGTAQTAAHTTGIYDGAATFRIGGRESAVAAEHHGGRLDEVGIYKRLLSSDELDWLYNSGTGRAYSELATAAGLPVIAWEHARIFGP